MQLLHDATEMSKSLSQLRIFIKELEILARIGIYSHEKAEKQPLVFDVEVDVLPPVDDAIGSIVDYDKIVQVLQRVVDQGHHDLLETMARKIFEELFRDKLIQNVLIRIAKPTALKNARSAGVEWFRSRGIAP